MKNTSVRDLPDPVGRLEIDRLVDLPIFSRLIDEVVEDFPQPRTAAEMNLQTAQLPPKARRPGRLIGAAAAVAVVLAVSGVVVAHQYGARPSVQTATPSAHAVLKPPHGGVGATAIKARLLDALDADAGYVLKDVETTVVPGQTSCPVTRIDYPYEPADGGGFSSLVISSNGCPGPVVEDEFVISSATVTSLDKPGQAATYVPDEVSVTGPGYETGFDSKLGTWWKVPSAETAAMAIANPDVIHSQLDADLVTLVGTGTIDGQQALKLTVGPVDSMSTDVLWVDSTSYLPLQEVLQYETGSPGNYLDGTITYDFTFTKPTADALGSLQLTIPPNYVQAPGMAAGKG